METRLSHEAYSAYEQTRIWAPYLTKYTRSPLGLWKPMATASLDCKENEMNGLRRHSLVTGAMRCRPTHEAFR
jgi:hypothetical protein